MSPAVVPRAGCPIWRSFRELLGVNFKIGRGVSVHSWWAESLAMRLIRRTERTCRRFLLLPRCGSREARCNWVNKKSRKCCTLQGSWLFCEMMCTTVGEHFNRVPDHVTLAPWWWVDVAVRVYMRWSIAFATSITRKKYLRRQRYLQMLIARAAVWHEHEARAKLKQHFLVNVHEIRERYPRARIWRFSKYGYEWCRKFSIENLGIRRAKQAPNHGHSETSSLK